MDYTQRVQLINGVLEAIGNHTALKLAGTSGDARLRAYDERRSEIAGMLELTRRLPEYAAIAAYLDAHRAWLTAQGERELMSQRRQEREG